MTGDEQGLDGAVSSAMDCDTPEKVNPYLAAKREQRAAPRGSAPTFRGTRAARGRGFFRPTPPIPDDVVPSPPAPKPTAVTAGPQPRIEIAHGNYPGYYGKRSLRDRFDARLALIDKAWIRGKTVLDVGCNAGLVTFGIAMHFEPKFVEGVDIDPELVKKARYALSERSSLVQPDDGGHLEESGNGAGDAMETDDRRSDRLPLPDLEYYPTTCTQILGILPSVGPLPSRDNIVGPSATRSFIQDANSSPPFPSNISFRCGDFLHESNPSAKHLNHDVILAFSVTKWIQLNHGDEGLRRFFKRCYTCLVPGGCLLLEPQPYESYRKASVHFSVEMERNYRNIVLKSDDFEQHLKEVVGFTTVELLGIPSNLAKGFQRSIFRCVK
ncbi:hypothetical protein HKX48_007611 [Thoreauomyces humboldtii]|nr:hypothetical protein HKX48_007611 [Thoreauomyces humboldtii]